MMSMTRYFFISTDLEDLAHFERDLKQAGFVTPQLHALTEYEDKAHRRNVHQISPFMRSDVVHSTLVGAACGLCLAALVSFVIFMAGWYDTWIGSAPFILLAIVLLGFCTWLGGLWGIQTTNTRMRRFKQVVSDGKHVFFVDQAKGRGKELEKISNRYPSIEMAGRGRGAPRWIVVSQHRIKRFFSETFP